MVATIRLDRSKCRQLDNHRVWVFWDHGEEGEKHRTGLVCGLALVDNYDVDDPTIDFGVVAVDERATEAEYRFEDELIVLRDAAGWSREVPVCWVNVRLADGDVLVVEDDSPEEHVALARRLATPLTSGEVLDYLHSVNRLCQRRPQEFATDYRWASYRPGKMIPWSSVDDHPRPDRYRLADGSPVCTDLLCCPDPDCPCTTFIVLFFAGDTPAQDKLIGACQASYAEVKPVELIGDPEHRVLLEEAWTAFHRRYPSLAWFAHRIGRFKDWAGPRLPRRAPEPVAPSKVGRNAPCPCGSGRKFKRCCWGGDLAVDPRMGG